MGYIWRASSQGTSPRRSAATVDAEDDPSDEEADALGRRTGTTRAEVRARHDAELSRGLMARGTRRRRGGAPVRRRHPLLEFFGWLEVDGGQIESLRAYGMAPCSTFLAPRGRRWRLGPPSTSRRRRSRTAPASPVLAVGRADKYRRRAPCASSSMRELSRCQGGARTSVAVEYGSRLVSVLNPKFAAGAGVAGAGGVA